MILPEPFLPRLEAYRLRTRRRMAGSRKGSHPSPRRGTSLEFADYRSYAPGDDLRSVDWGLYARTDRLYVRVFQEEEDLFVYLFVDGSASMGLPGDEPRYRAAAALAEALAYTTLAAGDAVRVHVLDDGPARVTPWYRSRQRLLDVSRFLEPHDPRGEVRLRAGLARHLRTIHRPGKAVLFSDFLYPVTEIESAIRLLLSASLDVAMIRIEAPGDATPPEGPWRLVDSETGEEVTLQVDASVRSACAGRLHEHDRQVRSLCHRYGIVYATYRTSQRLEDFVLAELPALGLLGV